MDSATLLTLLSATLLYVLGGLTPGPNMAAVAAAGLGSGRSAALWVASGVATGAFIWFLGVSYGLIWLFETYPWSLRLLSLLGGAYLLYLGGKGFWAALHSSSATIRPGRKTKGLRAWGSGLMVTLSNPKALLFWTSVVTYVTESVSSLGVLVLFAFVLALTGMVVYGAYGFVFSSRAAQRLYERAQRFFEFGFAFVFAALGLVLIVP